MAASVSLFARLGNLWKGFLSLWVSDIEKNNPEIAYENSINSMIEKHQSLKKATASIIRRREDLEQRLGARAKELEQTSGDLEGAVDTGQDDLAMVLISRKSALEAEVLELQSDLDQAKSDAEDAKASLLNIQGEIGKLRSEKDRMLAKMKSAQARLQVQQQLDGLSVDAEVKALDNVRQHIETQHAEAKLGSELKGESLDGRLEKLRRQTGDVTARRQLEEMKGQARRGESRSGQKTL
ncbi:MAG: PspA/IM30 family protein [Myxococcales bacterium]|nr:PspA/IM30 family protein [Myxococcales bacterium]